MNMINVELMRFDKKRFPVALDLDKLKFAEIFIKSGDEILVYLEDGGDDSSIERKVFDTGKGTRVEDYNDGDYVAFDCKSGINLFEQKEWKERKDPYEFYLSSLY